MHKIGNIDCTGTETKTMYHKSDLLIEYPQQNDTWETINAKD